LRSGAILGSDAIAISVVRDRSIVWASPGLEAMFGYAPGQLAGRPTRILHASDKSYALAQNEHVARAARGDTVREQARLVRRDGTMVWVSITGTLLDAATRETMWVFADTTAQRTAEKRLSIRETFLLHKGALAQVGGWYYDVLTDTLEWSSETRRLHDVPPGYRPTLKQAFSFYTPESRPVIECAIRQALSCGASWDLELALVSATGRPLWARVTGEAEYEDGAVVRLIGAFQDVTERRRRSATGCAMSARWSMAPRACVGKPPRQSRIRS
jgi:PAS domain S-box-containing protein